MSAHEAKSLEQFSVELSGVDIYGQWEAEKYLEAAIGGPQPAGVPRVWKWETVYQRLQEACDVLQESTTARRALMFRNPALKGGGGTTHTIAMGIQMIKPGEMAWAHRHTPAALRFVIKGNERMYTVVDGEICPMEDYDLILTPQWTWHDHHNETEDYAIWVDVLDVPLIRALNALFYEPYAGNRQQPRRLSESEYLRERVGTIRPTWEKPKLEHLPVRYQWRDTEAQLRRMVDLPGSPFDGLSLEYVNPMTGGPAMPTLGCWIQMLRPGEGTKAHRHTSSAIYFVVRGEGTTVVGEEELHWGPNDAFCVPNWAWHEHINRSSQQEAILFSVNDIPVLRAFGLYREEPESSLNLLPAPLPPSG